MFMKYEITKMELMYNTDYKPTFTFESIKGDCLKHQMVHNSCLKNDHVIDYNCFDLVIRLRIIMGMYFKVCQ